MSRFDPLHEAMPWRAPALPRLRPWHVYLLFFCWTLFSLYVYSRFSTLGAGVTWRTPWKAKLSVGAENLMSRGKNPFGVQDTRPPLDQDQGRVPYVRYQQDL